MESTGTGQVNVTCPVGYRKCCTYLRRLLAASQRPLSKGGKTVMIATLLASLELTPSPKTLKTQEYILHGWHQWGSGYANDPTPLFRKTFQIDCEKKAGFLRK
jgi:hypothetical protein